MHSTIVASKAGQLRGCTSFGASISMAIETANLHHAPQHDADGAGAGRHAGERAGHAARHQGPRHHHHCGAIQRRPEHPSRRDKQPVASATSTPITACAEITRHGDIRCGILATRAWACSSRQALDGRVASVVHVIGPRVGAASSGSAWSKSQTCPAKPQIIRAYPRCFDHPVLRRTIRTRMLLSRRLWPDTKPTCRYCPALS